MYQSLLQRSINNEIASHKLDIAGKDLAFYTRFLANAEAIRSLYADIYGSHPKAETCFTELIATITRSYQNRSSALLERDVAKEKKGNWFLSNQLVGMSLYVDRFCGNLNHLPGKLGYFTKLGVDILHLMPVFQSPANESDGGYAVSDFRKVDERFGNIEDLVTVRKELAAKDMYLLMDIVLNHTSNRHEWALKARAGDPVYQEYFYMYDDRQLPDRFDETMPDIFPESSPGNFTYVEECNKWVMTVFHHYQWDLNYTNPSVFIEMLDTVLFYANLGVDILRIDAPAFIWKKIGTTSQNLPEVHLLLQLIKQCVQVAAPGIALLGEAIVAPNEIMQYFGTGNYTAKECDFAYHATQMALQWDALATGDTRVMLAAQPELLQKPFGTSWITYTRCHDDIGLGYDDSMIAAAGFDPYLHRKYLKEYYSGNFPGSMATGALFSVNPKTQDARISGSLASLCGLEKAIVANDPEEINMAICKIVLMQAMSFFIGGLPMLFYGDEAGYTNDYSYLQDPSKSYDNRWMHRPLTDWKKNALIDKVGTPEEKIFSATRDIISLRKKLPLVADLKNIVWLLPHNIHVAGFIRTDSEQKLYCLFNFSNKESYVTWYAFKQHGKPAVNLYDHWNDRRLSVGADHEYLAIPAYSFCLLEVVD